MSAQTLHAIPVAGRRLKVGHEVRQPGEPVPEALEWDSRVVERLMNQHMLKVQFSGVPSTKKVKDDA